MENNVQDIKFILLKTLNKIKKFYSDYLININEISNYAKKEEFDKINKHQKKCTSISTKIDDLYKILENIIEKKEVNIFNEIISLSKTLNIENEVNTKITEILKLLNSIYDLKNISELILDKKMRSIKNNIDNIKKSKTLTKTYKTLNNAPKFLDTKK